MGKILPFIGLKKPGGQLCLPVQLILYPVPMVGGIKKGQGEAVWFRVWCYQNFLGPQQEKRWSEFYAA